MNRGLDTAVSKMDVSPTEAFLAEYDYASAVPACIYCAVIRCTSNVPGYSDDSEPVVQSRETAVGMPTAVVLSKSC